MKRIKEYTLGELLDHDIRVIRIMAQALEEELRRQRKEEDEKRNETAHEG